MSLTPSLTRVCSLIKTAGQAGDIGAAGAGAVAIAGVTLSLPWSAVCAAGIIALAGAAVMVERRDAAESATRADEHDRRAEDVRQWVEAFAQHEACKTRGLAAAIEAHLANNPDALTGLPEAITRDHLTTFLSIIKAQGDEQTKLLEEHDGFVRAVSAQVIDRLDAINKSLARIEGLVELTHGEVRSMAAVIVETGKALSETRSLVAELLWKDDHSRSPALHIPLDTSGLESQRFIFRSRTLACVGRRDEFIELDTWLHGDTRLFSWDLWTAVAGMGKSRLALELCLKLPASWDAGFMDWDAGRNIDWTTWTPGRNTLIVCDYVAREVDRIKTMLDRLAGYTGSHRVRVLLLERPIARFERPGMDGVSDGLLSLPITQAAAEGWWTRLGIGTDGSFKTTHARQMAGGRPERILEGISAPALREMVREVAATHMADDTTMPDDTGIEHIAGLIEAVTPNRRPLYIAMAAETIDEGAQDGTGASGIIDAKTLVEHIRDKEDRKHWTPALVEVPAERGTADGSRRLLALATLCGGLEGNTLRDALNDERFKDVDGDRLLPNADQYDDGAVYARLVPDADGHNAPKLEPDLLGECFVLGFLMDQPELAAKMVAVGWDHFSDGVADFLRRAAGNFPEHPGLETLLHHLPPELADFTRADALIARAQPTLQADDWAAMTRIGQAALDRDDAGPCELAIALFLILTGHQVKDDLPTVLERLRSLAKETDEPAIRTQLAKGLINAIAHTNNDTDQTDRILDQLRTLVQDHPDEPAVCKELANGLFNALIVKGPASPRAAPLVSELQTLLSSSPEIGARFAADLIPDAQIAEPTELNQAYLAFFIDLLAGALEEAAPGPGKDAFDDARTFLLFIYKNKWPAENPG